MSYLKVKANYNPDQQKTMEFLKQNTAVIEVAVDGKLQRVYFPIRPVCEFISDRTSTRLMVEVDRES
jgi:hypothetical protein